MFCSLLESTAKDGGLTDESYESYNFTNIQKLYLLNMKLKHQIAMNEKYEEMRKKDEEMRKKDKEIDALTRNASEWGLLAVSINLSNFRTTYT